MLFLGDELWSRQMTRTAKYTIHGIIVSLATAFIICGDAMVFHYIESGYHLYTVHGITGKSVRHVQLRKTCFKSS